MDASGAGGRCITGNRGADGNIDWRSFGTVGRAGR